MVCHACMCVCVWHGVLNPPGMVGMVVDSRGMRQQVPGEKIKKIRKEARGLSNLTVPSARDISRIVGKMNAMSQGIPHPRYCFTDPSREISPTRN